MKEAKESFYYGLCGWSVSNRERTGRAQEGQTEHLKSSSLS